jgi:hypothetical protein
MQTLSVLEQAQLVRDNDLPSFYDDVHDASGGMWSASSESDISDVDRTVDKKSRLPRRIRTFHGLGDHRQSSLSLLSVYCRYIF